MEKNIDQSNSSSFSTADTNFHPSGAVAFFIAMILFYAALWFVLFFIMKSRG